MTSEQATTKALSRRFCVAPMMDSNYRERQDLQDKGFRVI